MELTDWEVSGVYTEREGMRETWLSDSKIKERRRGWNEASVDGSACLKTSTQTKACVLDGRVDSIPDGVNG